MTRRKIPSPPSKPMIAALDAPANRDQLYLFSYRDSALQLSLDYENKYQEEGDRPAIQRLSRFLALPVIYLFLHFFELRLKGLIARLATLALESAPKLLRHGLAGLWKEFRRLYLVVFPPEPGATVPHGFAEGDKLFGELASLDPTSQAARYAKSNKGGLHFADFRGINMTELNRACIFMMDALDGRASDIAIEEDRRRRAQRRKAPIRRPVDPKTR